MLLTLPLIILKIFYCFQVYFMKSTKEKVYTKNYIGDRWWQIVGSTIIALLTGAIGLLSGIILS